MEPLARYSLAPPGGESVLAWISSEHLLLVQIVVNAFVTLGIARVCWRLAGSTAAWLGVLVWTAWPETHLATYFPYYYYWPNVWATAVALAWVEGRERWTGLLMAVWVQFRATAIGPLGVVTLRSWRQGLVAIGLLALTAGHARTQVWHDLYIGIGCRPNPYGIVYDDTQGIATAARYGIAFKAPGYEAVLRREYLHIARTNPGLVARNWALNTWDAMRGWSLIGHQVLWLVPLIVGANLRDRAYRDLAAVWFAQCVTLGFVTRPQQCYLWETMALVCILGVSGGVRLVRPLAEQVLNLRRDNL